MSIGYYNEMKKKYESTKPIRGRSEHVCPIGDRRRDWERVVQDGDKYGARLYDTNCVMYYPNGDVEFDVGGWATPSTTAFITMYAPDGVGCYKRYNKIWVETRHNQKAYPIPDKGKFLLKHTPEGYVPAEIPKVQQRVIDRTKSRDVRKSVEPFRNYCRNMLKLADGWLSHDLVKQFQVRAEHNWMSESITFRDNKFPAWSLRGRLGGENANLLYGFMSTATEDEYPNLLVLLAEATQDQERRVVSKYTTDHEMKDGTKFQQQHEIYEYKYRPQSVITRIDAICQQACDVTKVVEVEAGKVITNAV